MYNREGNKKYLEIYKTEEARKSTILIIPLVLLFKYFDHYLTMILRKNAGFS